MLSECAGYMELGTDPSLTHTAIVIACEVVRYVPIYKPWVFLGVVGWIGASLILYQKCRVVWGGRRSAQTRTTSETQVATRDVPL